MCTSPETFVAQVTSAVAAVTIGPGAGYSWLGERTELPASVVSLASPEVVREALTQGVTRRLYADYFSSGRPRPAQPAAGHARRLSGRLAEANCGHGYPDPGWRVVGIEGDRAIAERNGLRLWVRPDEMGRADAGLPAPGTTVSVLLAPDAPMFSPGFYMVLGDRSLHPQLPRHLDRFYAHLREEGAEECVRRTTSRLNSIGLAFRLKVVDDPDGFDRCDSAIFVFQRRDRARSVPEVLDLVRDLAEHIAPGVPALTRRIAPGVGFAEDPGKGESFGADRCRLIAEGLMAAEEAHADSLEARVACVADRFRAAGTRIDRPHLGPDSPGDLDPHPPPVDHLEERVPCP